MNCSQCSVVLNQLQLLSRGCLLLNSLFTCRLHLFCFHFYLLLLPSGEQRCIYIYSAYDITACYAAVYCPRYGHGTRGAACRHVARCPDVYARLFRCPAVDVISLFSVCQIVLVRWSGPTIFIARWVPTVGWRWYSTAANLTNDVDLRFYLSRTSQFHALQSTILAADTTSLVSKLVPLILVRFHAWHGWHIFMTLMVKSG